MSNDDLPQSAELASAYLDGELDGTQRAAASADPDVVAAIDSFTRVRAALGEVAPVDPFTKNNAISAALAEFDALHATSTPADVPASATTAAVVSLQSRRHRVYRIVSGAAAAAIVGVVAIAALNSNGGSSNDFSSSATAAPAVASAEAPDLKSEADEAVALEAAPPEATNSAGGAAADSAAAPAPVPIVDTMADLTQYAASREVSAATAMTAAPAATVLTAEPTSAASPDDQAAGYAAVACLSSDQVVLGAIVYQGTPALAVRNTATGALQAIADTDCRILAEVVSP